MLQHFKKNYHRYTLGIIFLLLVWYIKYYYPNPGIAWDTNYYLIHSITGKTGIRPIGYSAFLSWVYQFTTSLSAIVAIQFITFFLSVVLLLEAVQRTIKFPKWLYIFTGIIMLMEPVGLYFSNTIYSDQPFSVLTYFYLASLLLFIQNRNILFLLLHILALYCALEVRFIALFYPLFSILVLLLSGRKGFLLKIVGVVLIFLTFKSSYNRNVEMNKKAFNVPIHSAFSGWTQANNAMYALHRINTPAKFIKDPKLRDLHSWFMHYFDTTSKVNTNINTDYLWDTNGPLAPLAKKTNDSLWSVMKEVPIYMDMFVMAPKLERYGLYIQRQYPYEFLMGYILPNAKTMLHPHIGEMSDYYYHPDLSEEVKSKYDIDVSCRQDIFKEKINSINDYWYGRRLILFAIAMAVMILLWFKKRNIVIQQRNVFILLSFTLLFYGGMIYSSWCIYRYILPILPVMTLVTVSAFYMMIKGILNE